MKSVIKPSVQDSFLGFDMNLGAGVGVKNPFSFSFKSEIFFSQNTQCLYNVFMTQFIPT